MNSKIVFLDIDGTLAKPSGEVSSRVQEGITKARENGHYVFLCTGRNRSGVRSIMEIGFDGTICSAGGYVEVNNQRIYESFLSEEDLKEARDIFEKNDILYNMEATHVTFSSQEMNEIFTLGSLNQDAMNSEMERLLNEHKNLYNIHDHSVYDQNPIPIHKICFIAKNKESLKEVQKRLSHKYNFVIHNLFTTDTINGEIIIKGTNKGNAVRQVVEYLGLDIKDSICFGDSMNDLEMIQACHHSVVMGNGVDQLKAYATSVCESIEEDGVYHEMKRLGLF